MGVAEVFKQYCIIIFSRLKWKNILTSFLAGVSFATIMFCVRFWKAISVEAQDIGKLESPLENARFLKAEIINSLLLFRRKK
jgi:hypothetical protein